MKSIKKIAILSSRKMLLNAFNTVSKIMKQNFLVSNMRNSFLFVNITLTGIVRFLKLRKKKLENKNHFVLAISANKQFSFGSFPEHSFFEQR